MVPYVQIFKKNFTCFFIPENEFIRPFILILFRVDIVNSVLLVSFNIYQYKEQTKFTDKKTKQTGIHSLEIRFQWSLKIIV